MHITGPGIMYLAPQPRCPVHGQMHHDFTLCAWACKGFDGEGCSHRVTDEEVECTMKPAGTITSFTFEWAH